MSGVGKGVCTASLSHLLQQLGFSVTTMKIDGYLNVDAGTLNPYRHGETFVLDDGTECDLDLGTYERFLDTTLNRHNYMTSGKSTPASWPKSDAASTWDGTSRSSPRHRGDQVPHPPQGPGRALRHGAGEIGGTVGDIENVHFIEAARELIRDEGRDNVMYIHVTMVPWSEATGEQKSKPTQHSVKKLLELGVQPDIIVCRSKQGLQNKVREKISLHGNVASTMSSAAPIPTASTPCRRCSRSSSSPRRRSAGCD